MKAPVSRVQIFARSGIGAKTLLLSLATLAVLCIYRAYSFVVTGFFVSDEFGYAYDAIHGTVYGFRWFFGSFNIALFHLLGITSIESFAILMPFYMFFWGTITLTFFYMMMKLLGFNQRTIALSLLSSLFLVSFMLLSLGFLTEPVGLALAMGGVYFTLKFYKIKSEWGRPAFALLFALFFSAASGTREPYYVFLFGGGLLVVVMAVKQASESPNGLRKKALALLSTILFVGPAASTAYIGNSAGSQVLTIGNQFLTSIVTNPSVPGRSTATTVSVDRTEVGTATVVTSTVVGNRTTNLTTTTTTTNVIHTTIISSVQVSYPFYAKSLLLNTLVIFVGGVFIGWGPITFVVGLLGFLLLVRDSARRRQPLSLLILFLTLVTLGSYLIVSFIFAPDPGYFSFLNYSTIIRFSDTAIPAFFLTAPVVFSVISRKRALTYGFVASLVIFALVAVPAYESAATSNLQISGVNPFDLSYMSPAVQVRNYVLAHPGGEFNIIGVPYGWYFNFGIDSLQNTTVYPLDTHALSPPINYTRFLQYRWTVFYVYCSPDFHELREYAPYLLPLVEPGVTTSSAPTPYKLTASQVVIDNPQFVLVKVSLFWNST